MLSANVVLGLASSIEELEGAEDDLDRIVTGKSMSVEGLVEDEVPMIPRHEFCALLEV